MASPIPVEVAGIVLLQFTTYRKICGNPALHLKAPLDCVAGLTVGVMAVPQAMSYALVAEMPGAIYGLYNALMGELRPLEMAEEMNRDDIHRPSALSHFWYSPHLITGPTAVMSILVKSSIPSHLGSVGDDRDR